MAKPRTSWQPLPHEPVLSLSENLRWVRAPIPGISLQRTMTVARLNDDRLVIWSAIALSEPSMQELERWGTPAILIVPSALHRLDAAAYCARYKGLQVFAPRGAERAAAEVVTLTGRYQDFPKDAAVSLVDVPGIRDKEGVMRVRSADGTTAVLNDLLFNMPVPRDLPAKLVVKLFGSAPGPRVSRLVKLGWCNDRAALRGAFQSLADIPDLQRVVVAHDSVMHGADARAALQAAVQQLA